MKTLLSSKQNPVLLRSETGVQVSDTTEAQ